ncbi:MAG: thiosulfate oxidation carrier protein SoxY [Halioglobus sp.]
MSGKQHASKLPGLRRRALLKGALAVTGAAYLPVSIAAPEDVDAAVAELFGSRTPQPGKVTVKIPPISENGYSVPLSVKVDSPMTAQNHVVRIAVFAEENPIALVANFELGQRAGKASIQSRIRMGGSQRIRAVAEMSDGSLWSGYAFSIVTLAACVV